MAQTVSILGKTFDHIASGWPGGDVVNRL